MLIFLVVVLMTVLFLAHKSKHRHASLNRQRHSIRSHAEAFRAMMDAQETLKRYVFQAKETGQIGEADVARYVGSDYAPGIAVEILQGTLMEGWCDSEYEEYVEAGAALIEMSANR